MSSRKRENGTGSVYQNTRGTWTAALTLPSMPGKAQRRKTRTAKTEKQARRELAKMRRELEISGDLMTRTPTVEEWADYWLKTVCGGLKPKTKSDYERVMRLYVTPFMGTTKLDKVTPTMILNLYAWMQAPKSMDGLGLSSSTALGVHRRLKKMLKDATALAGLQKNPADVVPAPSPAVVKQDVLTSEQALKFLTTHAAHPYVARYATGFFTGARQGEILGLQVEDVRILFDRTGTPVDVHVELAWTLQRLTYNHGCNPHCGGKRGADCPRRFFDAPANHEIHQVHGGLHLLRPKTSGSWRVTSGGPLLAQILDRVIGERTSGFVFTTDVGAPIDPRIDWQIWQEWLQEAGLPKMGTHAQRHTASTLLAISGADEKTRMDMLGHASTKINRRYTHDDMTLQSEASARLAGVLNFEYTGQGVATIGLPGKAKDEPSPA